MLIPLFYSLYKINLQNTVFFPKKYMIHPIYYPDSFGYHHVIYTHSPKKQCLITYLIFFLIFSEVIGRYRVKTDYFKA